MAGLTWYPLYWVYHDSWFYTYSKIDDKGFTTSRLVEHPGHVHFFMLDFPITNPGQQAYHGEQKYSFSLENVWGGDSEDLNKQDNIRVIGRPQWFFYVEEYWRRIYLQQWDYPDENSRVIDDTAKKGIKYDATKDCHSYGPYREGKDNYFFNTSLNRTLPIEYWKNAEKTLRHHYLRSGEGVTRPYEWDFGEENPLKPGYNTIENPGDYPVQKKMIPGQKTDGFGRTKEEFESIPENKKNGIKLEITPNETDILSHPWEDYFDGDEWAIPRGKICKGDISKDLIGDDEVLGAEHPGTICYSDEDKARRNYSDLNYISPIIEYQKVIQLNWERLPGWEERDIDKEKNEDGIETGKDFGDDWEIEVTSPFKNQKGVVLSPFSVNGEVQPIGVYCNKVVEDNKITPLRYIEKPWEENPPELTEEEIEKIPERERKSKIEERLKENAMKRNKCLPTRDMVYGEDGVTRNTVTWNCPSGMPLDGKWVEQCLGAYVLAKARVVLEDNFGQRSVSWIETMSFSLGDTFSGMDDDYQDKENMDRGSIEFTISNFSKDPVTGRRTLIIENATSGFFKIYDENGDERTMQQEQDGTNVILILGNTMVTGTWKIVFPSSKNS